MDHPVFLIAAIGATFFIAGLVKGVTGMGLPTVAMGVLGALISPLSAAALMLAPSLVTNLWQLLSGPNLRPVCRRFGLMMAAIVAGTLAGAGLLAGSGSGLTRAALGGVLIVYALYALLARPFTAPAQLERVLSPLVGGVTGVATGATGVFVIPAVPYLQALGLPRDDLVQALGLSFTVSTLALAAGLASHGALPSTDLAASGLAVVPALAGMGAGQWVRRHIRPAAFRRGFLSCLLLLGLEMALRPLL